MESDMEAKTLASRERLRVPDWLRQHADLWIQHPSVESVVLFGSRASGRSNPQSDWDVAILHSGNTPPRLERLDGFSKHPVDLPLLSIRTWRRDLNRIGSLSYELVTRGEVIAGRMPSYILEDPVMSEDDLALHLEYAFVELANAVCGLRDATRGREITEPIENLDAERAVAYSANGAERVAKALCVFLQIPYDRTHNVEELAGAVPEKWKRKMDGFTSYGHTSPYTGVMEPIRQVARRISKAISLLEEILPACLNEISTASATTLIRKVKGASPLHTAIGFIDDNAVHPKIVHIAKKLDSLQSMMRDTDSN
ncbi:MAG: nucleotidyltransferase domain-containing protein [Gammaproteobacteria bacterium]|nr:nucleotidyltransferase domain-containing protein [Gammaproteobacteria bacterium]